MKLLLLLPVLAAPFLMTACETTVVEHHPRRVGYVERDVAVRHTPDYRYRRDVYNDPYVRRDVYVAPRPRRNVVVVNPRPAYEPQVSVRYYNDSRGRYYMKSGRRVYVNAGVYY